jgi:hypothetical protein
MVEGIVQPPTGHRSGGPKQVPTQVGVGRLAAGVQKNIGRPQGSRWLNKFRSAFVCQYLFNINSMLFASFPESAGRQLPTSVARGDFDGS